MTCLNKLPGWPGLTIALLGLPSGAMPQEPVLGEYRAHDPFTMIKDGCRRYVFRTGDGIMSKWSTDKGNWTYGGRVYPGNPPAWTASAVPNFTGTFWGPDVACFNGTRHYY